MMSVFDPIPTPIPDNSRKHRSTSETITIIIAVTAVGLSVVVSFVLFVIWFRMKKKRECREADIQLEELSPIGVSFRQLAAHEVGIAR